MVAAFINIHELQQQKLLEVIRLMTILMIQLLECILIIIQSHYIKVHVLFINIDIVPIDILYQQDLIIIYYHLAKLL